MQCWLLSDQSITANHAHVPLISNVCLCVTVCLCVHVDAVSGSVHVEGRVEASNGNIVAFVDGVVRLQFAT